MSYQPVWIRGISKANGDRPCDDRYAIIRDVVRPYTRQITVWDLGANLGYFGCRLAHDFEAVSVMVEQRKALVDLCRANALPTTIAMTWTLSVADLTELAASEYADVVLALNVLHHIEDWRGALAAIRSLGESVILETPGRGDTGSANYQRSQDILDALDGAEVLGWSQSHVTPGIRRPLFRLTQPKVSVTSGYAYGGRVRARGPHPAREHVIASSLSEKTITFNDGESRSWVPGMNLWNWLQLGGSWPLKSSTQQATVRAANTLTTPHGDLRPWNVILQGQDVQLIDVGHRTSCEDATGLTETIQWIDRPELAHVR